VGDGSDEMSSVEGSESRAKRNSVTGGSKAASVLGSFHVLVACVALSCDSAPDVRNESNAACSSGISWWGTFPGSAEVLVLEACLNDRCWSRRVPVEADGNCFGVETEWVNDWATWACAGIRNQRSPAIEVIFTIDATKRRDELRDGDIVRFSVARETDGHLFVAREDRIEYDRTSTECATKGITFGVEQATNDGGKPPQEP
jgi:hypothetical protein